VQALGDDADGQSAPMTNCALSGETKLGKAMSYLVAAAEVLERTSHLV